MRTLTLTTDGGNATTGFTVTPEVGVGAGDARLSQLIPFVRSQEDLLLLTGTVIPSNLVVNCPVFLAPIRVGQGMTPVAVIASGGTTPYTFSATGLPPGIVISTSGVISGTPTGATGVGSFAYHIQVIDAVSASATADCSMLIQTVALTMTCPVIAATEGQPIHPIVMSVGGGVPPYTFSAINLPPGIEMSSEGRLTGQPTTEGLYTYTTTVTDSVGEILVQDCDIRVAPRPIFPPSGFSGDFGEVVEVPFVECFEDFGIMASVFKDRNCLRIEYRRHGQELTDRVRFEIPDHMVKYIRWFAMSNLLEIPGPGQDTELADWCQQRWIDGLQRMNARRNYLQSQAKLIMGGAGKSVLGKAPPKARLPWQYGHIVR